jgi:hypothetical protein
VPDRTGERTQSTPVPFIYLVLLAKYLLFSHFLVAGIAEAKVSAILNQDGQKRPLAAIHSFSLKALVSLRWISNI